MASILIKNGRIWDGNRFFYRDILTQDRYISKIEENLSQPADFVYDATGKTVCPGLVDIHTHFLGISTDAYGTPAQSSCFPFGVTAAADAGAELGDQALLDSLAVKTAVFVCTDIQNDQVSLKSAEQLLRRYGNKAVGLKIYCTTSRLQTAKPLEQVCRFAKENRLSVMVHCSGSPISMAQILQVLDKGDILTHAFHGGKNSALEDNFESLRAAQKRGVVIDAGFAGHVHTDFGILRTAIKAGILPDLISTDITSRSVYTRGGRYGMTMCMSMARTAGMAEEDVFRAVTAAPAAALGRPWGQLTEGAIADIAVLDDTDEGFSLTDKAGNRLESPTGYRNMLTVSDGQIVYRY